MTELRPQNSLDALEVLHSRLDAHFSELKQRRQVFSTEAPVFALEHGLSLTDIDALNASVRFAVTHGFSALYWRQNWLPFVVYAAESGYDYEGNEFWPSFEQATPGWAVHGDRDRIRTMFRRFGTDYGGAIPTGGFAQNFPIIAWPITHAVLPVYLQRHLAQLLYEFRMGLTTELLRQPEDLGKQLSARAWGYTERFRIFCSNTSLLGHVAAALLSGEDEESPYLLHSTLLRLVEGLEQERQSKFWLQGARNAASRVRAQGFQPGASRTGAGTQRDRLPNPTDPRLVLRGSDTGWRAYAQLPDLRSLSRRLTHVYDELRTRRARVAGAEDIVLARGRLVTPGQQVRLTHWPDPETSFIELEDGSSDVNALLRDQVEISRGPVWLFKRRAPGLAVEVKSKVVRPDNTYYLVHAEGWVGEGAPGLDPIKLDVAGAAASRLVVPEQLTAAESDALLAAGLSVVTNVTIRPVGIVASSWDGEGAVEWIAGEPGLIGIHAEQVPAGGALSLDGERYNLEWPEGSSELYLTLDDLSVGDHELRVTLTGGAQQTLAEGSLLVTIRDPQVRRDAAEVGEGIRLLASPARPNMSEIWAPGAVTIAGPDGLRVDLAISLRGEAGRELSKISHPITLPLVDSDWIGVAKKVRNDSRFTGNFDQAESLELTVSRAGVGQATLRADRGFQPLRWQLLREREQTRAHLIDRTDSPGTRVLLYRFETPVALEELDPNSDVVAPATGGLLTAKGGEGIDASATILLPTRPNDLLGIRVKPNVPTGPRTPGELLRLVFHYRRWAEADLPGDIFAQHHRDAVLEAITRALVSLACGNRWAAVENRLANSNDPLGLIDEVQALVGDSDDHTRLAKKIGRSLYAWQDPASLLTGFDEVIQGSLRANGVIGHDSAPRFLLSLAGRPSQVLSWEEVERGYLMQQVIASPALLRAARFAVVGTRLMGEAELAARGF
ncbi:MULTISPECIES: hypothetical protein [unclassified Microbacterium]|uniref:hypothetical protein n=1 Tax=unclassified Microbacterium TaxID=2609290 RepID=UPI003440E816